MAESGCQEQNRKPRAALYVDGFNLYHPIHDMGEPFLKWMNLWKLGQLFSEKQNAELVRAVFCTAVPDGPADKKSRHDTFNAAQIASGVTVVKGHHVVDPTTGKRSEKQSDINVALSLILDAQDDVYDVAFLLSADSDQAATARVFRERFSHKKLIAVAPPTKSVPHKVIPYASSHFVMTKDHIEESVFVGHVTGFTGRLIMRPTEYAPPAWWIHPDNRPKKIKKAAA